MKFQQVRNATTKITYGGATFLVDPWLAPKGAMGSFRTLARQSLRLVLDARGLTQVYIPADGEAYTFV